MKQKRAKQYRKQIHQYISTFKFKPPIQCIVDDNVILECERTKFDVIKAISRTVQTEVKLMITQCCINHLYETRNQPAIDIAKKMEKRRCNHKETQSSKDCIGSIVNIDGKNKHRYLVVTQDDRLRQSLRTVPGVPLIYMKRSVMIMEPMSPVSERVVQETEARKLTSYLNDPRAGVQAQDGEEEIEEQGPAQKKRKGPKGPNPLSVKKPKKHEEPEEGGTKRKRKRAHKRGTKTHESSETGNSDEKENVEVLRSEEPKENDVE
ncbi:hypothetical protein KL918_002351 [Ogataea parapolymorpha]|uniref:U three protein 23 n=1 Tax=Ogataea parapolymorpha (strain ATCC 26012 / BCRC 20466 / JCM 22074 / NRRL Y-7560 / DL-1) TaxID=871575 RepID=W1QLN9_OGAPD|nr:rRNA-processing protein UTP23 [Ogataea parapolymorpha DL-1]ESX02874.1 rRNA-processing protein UTP23 [Ogataea parapolymorpha DL-1]KAG7867754.1 hypothetical protein KL918_002351 [Ogataea parapolymorpha]KAG7870439.1 hypothetical protein KL916_005056 [Ogataea parapolymorpha]KAG7881334.1 hypothetical protein KL938_003464 [Ogataea parapolymorpha]